LILQLRKAIDNLKAGQVIYCDYHETLFNRYTNTLDIELVEALKEAQSKGIRIVLWTHNSFFNTVEIISYLKQFGLNFDEVKCGVEKGDLIIDNLAVNPTL
jgi:hydroxymethylpyrimidine pyrophosphatase-like HAD family hydrolase